MRKRITFGMLDHALTSLGFQVADDSNGHKVYKHETRPGMLILPVRRPVEYVSPAHLAVVKRTLADMDVVDPLEFASIVQAAG